MTRPAIMEPNVVVAAAFADVLSDALLRQYRQVLLRPALRRLHGLRPAEVDLLLEKIARHAIVLDARPGEAAGRIPARTRHRLATSSAGERDHAQCRATRRHDHAA